MKKNPYKELRPIFPYAYIQIALAVPPVFVNWLIRYCWKEKLFYIWPILPDALKNFHARITVMPLP